MNQITVEGTVPETFDGQKEFYLKIADKDIDKAQKFIAKTNTTFRSGGIAVRKQSIVSKCKAGDAIALTLGTQFRKDGVRLMALDFKKI